MASTIRAVDTERAPDEQAPGDVAASETGSDVATAALPTLDWSPDRACEALEALFRWVERSAIEAYEWYLREKRSKSLISKALRILAVALLTIGGILPILSLITDRRIAAEWGFVALAGGAGVLLMDRGFGFSASWARYMSVAMDLRVQLVNAQLSWAKRRLGLAAKGPGAAGIDDALAEVEAFARAVNEAVRAETEQWVVEFHQNLTELRASLGTHPR